MQITLEIPADVEQALLRRAAAEHKSLDCVTLDAVVRGLGPSSPASKKRDLSDIAGQRLMDADTLAALDEQRRIDPDLWK